MLTPMTPNFNCKSQPFFFKIKRRATNDELKTTPCIVAISGLFFCKHREFLLTFSSVMSGCQHLSGDLQFQQCADVIPFTLKTVLIVNGQYSLVSVPAAWNQVVIFAG